MTATKNNSGASLWQMTLMGLRYLSGRRLRTTLTTLSIVFGVALIFAINLVLPSMLQAFKITMTGISGSDITISSANNLGFDPQTVLPMVSAVDGVSTVTGVLRREFNLPTMGDSALGSTTQIEMIGVDPDSAQSVRQFVMSEGRFLEAGDHGAVVIPAGLAELSPELEIGTTFPLITAGGLRIYTVVGFLAEQGSMSTPQIYVTLSDAQDAFAQEGLINSIEVAVNAGADRDAVAAAIQQTLGDNYLLDGASSGTDAFASVQIGLAAFDLLGVLALFLGSFLIFNTFRTVIIERRHDLGMLRAIGATRRQITLMIVIESLVQGVIGTIIGLIAGYLLAAGMISLMTKLVSGFMNFGNVTLNLDFTSVIVAALLGILTALLAGFMPARAAGRISPLEALRPGTPASFSRTARWSLIIGGGMMALAVLMLVFVGSKGAVGGALLFLIGMVVASPALVLPAARLFSPLLTLWFAREGDLARGNMMRQPGRAAITGSTLMIGLAVLVLMAALVSSIGDLMVTLTNRNFSSDIILLPQSIGVYNNVMGADPALAEQIRQLPEVETVGTLRFANSTSDGKGVQVMGINPQEYTRIASLEFSQGTADEAFPALDSGRTAILSGIAQRTLGVNLGDSFVLQTVDGPQSYQVVGIANDILTFKIVAIFISQGNMAADFHKTEDIMAMINLRPGADEAAAFTAIQNLAADYPQFTARLTGQYRDELLNLSVSALGSFYVLALIILIPSALGLLNTLTINILERTREIGVVRAVGGSQSQVRRIVTGEALLLGIFGAAMGVLTGIAISYGFIQAFSTVGWNLPYTFPVIGIVAALIVGVLLALFASILPARNAAKLDIIRALQYE
ncbi:MAG: FtsX-like permease family protein [Anaerolineae bacterium]